MAGLRGRFCNDAFGEEIAVACGFRWKCKAVCEQDFRRGVLSFFLIT